MIADADQLSEATRLLGLSLTDGMSDDDIYTAAADPKLAAYVITLMEQGWLDALSDLADATQRDPDVLKARWRTELQFNIMARLAE